MTNGTKAGRGCNSWHLFLPRTRAVPGRWSYYITDLSDSPMMIVSIFKKNSYEDTYENVALVCNPGLSVPCHTSASSGSLRRTRKHSSSHGVVEVNHKPINASASPPRFFPWACLEPRSKTHNANSCVTLQHNSNSSMKQIACKFQRAHNMTGRRLHPSPRRFVNSICIFVFRTQTLKFFDQHCKSDAKIWPCILWRTDGGTDWKSKWIFNTR